MLGHEPYSHDCIKKMTVLFGSLFSDLKINRDASDNSVEQVIKVPLSYGPTDKALARSRQQPNLETPTAITLPRMSFELVDLRYAADRKLSNVLKVSKENHYSYSPVPYDFFFTLSIMHNQMVDGTRILEQILPFFTPQLNIPATIVEELNQVADIPVVLNQVTRFEDYEGDLNNRRTQIWTLSFTLKGYMFGPISTGGLIKRIETNYYTNLAANTMAANVWIWPGLDANGHPTTNTDIAIPYSNVNSTDDWTYITKINDV